MTEQGLPKVEAVNWYGIQVAAKTPPEIIAKLNNEIARILKLPEVRDTLTSQSTQPLATGPQETARWLASERERWAKVVKTSGFKLD